MCFSSKSTSSTFSPERNVLSMTLPSFMCLSFVRTNAPPLPGLTFWKSTIVYVLPSWTIRSPFLNSAVDTCIAIHLSDAAGPTARAPAPAAPPGGRERLGQDEPGSGVVRIARQPVAAEGDGVACPPGLAVEIGELRERQRGGIPGQSLLLSADGVGDRLIVSGHRKPVIRIRRFRCQPRFVGPERNDPMAARTSAPGTSRTWRNVTTWSA